MSVAAAAVGGDPLGREVGDDIELVFAHHLNDRNALLTKGSPLRHLPRRLVTERALRCVLDPGGIDAVVLVGGVDCDRAGPVGGLGERHGEVAVAEADHLQQCVAAAKGDAATDDHRRVTPQLVRLHRSLGHPGGS